MRNVEIAPARVKMSRPSAKIGGYQGRVDARGGDRNAQEHKDRHVLVGRVLLSHYANANTNAAARIFMLFG
jgi:hypothetical protein